MTKKLLLHILEGYLEDQVDWETGELFVSADGIFEFLDSKGVLTYDKETEKGRGKEEPQATS